MRVIKRIKAWVDNLTWRQCLAAIVATFMLALFACFFDWIVLNWISGCCEGGVCIPEWMYPQCVVAGGSHD